MPDRDRMHSSGSQSIVASPVVEWGGDAWERRSHTFFKFCFKIILKLFENGCVFVCVSTPFLLALYLCASHVKAEQLIHLFCHQKDKVLVAIQLCLLLNICYSHTFLFTSWRLLLPIIFVNISISNFCQLSKLLHSCQKRSIIASESQIQRIDKTNFNSNLGVSIEVTWSSIPAPIYRLLCPK